MTVRDDVVGRYIQYLDACNRRAWGELRHFVADAVVVNGLTRTREQYVAGIMATVQTFPDYRWDLCRAVLEGEWLAVHLYDTGTRTGPFQGCPGEGVAVSTDEFDMYRLVDGLIYEVEGTADNARLNGSA